MTPEQAHAFLRKVMGPEQRIIEGVARYAAEHGSWSLRLKPRNIDD
jgi:hypothetical protein